MDDRNAQVGWTEAQWNRVREEVLEAWQRVRVAGSFLPIYGSMPPGTTVVPSEVLKPDGSVDDRATADLLEIDLPVILSRQQILEEDLTSALLQFRRRATQLGQLEDWFIFNGTYPSIGIREEAADAFEQEKKTGLPDYRPDLPYLKALAPGEWAPMSGTPRPIAGVDHVWQIEGMRQRNPGSLGLIEAPRVERKHNYTKQAKHAEQAQQQAKRAQWQAAAARQQAAAARQQAAAARQQAAVARQQAAAAAQQQAAAAQQLVDYARRRAAAAAAGQRADYAQQQAADAQQQADYAQQQVADAQQQAAAAQRRADDAQQRADNTLKVLNETSPLDNRGLTQAIVDAINSLEENGYVAPYVCVFGRKPFQAAYKPIGNSTVLPRDRIEPLIGRELLHASGIDILPHRSGLYDLDSAQWPSRGVLLSMADEPIDLALAAEATPEFRQVDLEGRYVFSVFERFALRIKDANAIVPLVFEKPKAEQDAQAEP
jgi:uncharacterized linocin/CFP29 family protein